MQQRGFRTRAGDVPSIGGHKKDEAKSLLGRMIISGKSKVSFDFHLLVQSALP
jgi:hypothetical protein